MLWFNFAQVVVLVSCSFALLVVSTTVLAGWRLKCMLSSDGGGRTAPQPQSRRCSASAKILRYVLLLSCSLLVHVVLFILDRDDMFVCPVTPEVVINF